MVYRTKYIKYFTLLIALGCIFSILFFVSSFAIEANQQIHRLNTYSKDQILVLINRYRVSNNLNELYFNDQLQMAAEAKLDDMLTNDYFSHSYDDSVNWSRFISESNYKYFVVGENLGKGYDNPNELVSDWIKSPAHKANIINKSYEDTGIAIGYNKKSTNPVLLIVQHFGKKLE